MKNISQWERLSHILWKIWKIKNVPNYQPVMLSLGMQGPQIED
jgi:hypothetical protein